MKISAVKKKMPCSQCGESSQTLIKGTIITQGNGMKAEFKLDKICIPCLNVKIKVSEES